MTLLLTVCCLLAIVACITQDTETSAPGESTATSSNTDIFIPEESSTPYEFNMGNDEQGMERVKEVADDHYRNVIDAKKMGWENRKYICDHVYGSEFGSIWLGMIGTKSTSCSDWTFYAPDVELDSNQRHMIVIGRSPENKWGVANFGN